MTEIDFVLEEIQQIDFDMEYATKVIEPLTQEKSVAPSTQKQEVEPDLGYTGLSKVIVEAVSNEIDENIQPNNIKLGVSILGVEGNVEPDKPDQTKEVNPSTNEQIVKPDAGYELAEVKVNGVTSEIDENIISENIKEGVLILGVQGNFVGSGDPVLEASYRSLLDSTLGANTTKLPSELTIIEQYAFYNKTNLGALELPDAITRIGRYAFSGCQNFVINKLPTALTYVDENAFYNCRKIKFDKIPDGVLSIGRNAFYMCYALERLTMSNAITSIGEGAFRNCTGLIYVECFDKLTSIGNRSFQDTAIETFIIRRTTPPSLNTTSFLNTPIANGTGYIYVPDEAINTYKSATNWSTYADQIKGLSELE